jgi:phosphate transport system substrate-binding protein
MQNRGTNCSRCLQAQLRAAIVVVGTLGPLPVGAQQLRPPQAATHPKPDSLSLEQLRGEIDRIRQAIDKHRNNPIAPAAWRELIRIEAVLEEGKFSSRDQEKSLRARWSELSVTDGVQLWQAEKSSLEWRRNELQVEEGRRLFRIRHAELAKQAPTNTPQLRALGLDVLNYPRIDGSTSTQPLAMLVACRCFGASFAWVGAGQSRDRERWSYRDAFYGVEPEAELLEFSLKAQTDERTSERLATIINRLLATNASTHQAYLNLIEGRCDIGLIARPPYSEELDLAQKNSVELDVVPCALDAFVFLVHNENPIRNLTTRQIRDVYSGRVDRWQDVGGSEGRIIAYQREAGSASQQLMRSLVMKDVPLMNADGWPQLVGRLMSSVFLELSRSEWGLGYSVYYYERYMSGSARTRTIAVDGVEPTADTIRRRTYPFVAEVYVVTRKGIPADSPTANWRNWVLSSEGQAVVQESGYVPISDKAATLQRPR